MLWIPKAGIVIVAYNYSALTVNQAQCQEIHMNHFFCSSLCSEVGILICSILYMGLSSQIACIQIPVLPLPSCVTLGKWCNFSVPSVPHLKNEDTMAPASQGPCEDYVKFKRKMLMKVCLANNGHLKKVSNYKLLLLLLWWHLLIRLQHKIHTMVAKKGEHLIIQHRLITLRGFLPIYLLSNQESFNTIHAFGRAKVNSPLYDHWERRVVREKASWTQQVSFRAQVR